MDDFQIIVPAPEEIIIETTTPSVAQDIIIGPGQGGAVGPKGDSGGFYVHTQNTSDSTWHINHNLGYNPQVSVIDSSGSQVEGSVTWVSTNTLSITFSASFSGVAYLS